MTHTITRDTGAISRSQGDFFGRMRTSFANYRLYRKTLKELRSLSDRDLADLGISRSDIRDIAQEGIYRR